MTNAIEIEVINTIEKVRHLVDLHVHRHTLPAPYSPTMYIDLEGVGLCRHGSISDFTLLIHTGTPTRRTCLIDMHILGGQAFETAGV